MPYDGRRVAGGSRRYRGMTGLLGVSKAWWPVCCVAPCEPSPGTGPGIAWFMVDIAL